MFCHIELLCKTVRNLLNDWLERFEYMHTKLKREVDQMGWHSKANVISAPEEEEEEKEWI